MTYFMTIKGRLCMAAMRINTYAEDKDLSRNHVNYGELSAWKQVLEDMGHRVGAWVWEDENGCLRIPQVEIDGIREEFAGGKEKGGTQVAVT